MSKIPDDVVEKAAKALYQSDKWDDPEKGPGEKMKDVWRAYSRRAGDVFVEWALEEAAAYMEKTLPHLSLQEYAAAIRALNPKQDA